jgi:hypothetical protein
VYTTAKVRDLNKKGDRKRKRRTLMDSTSPKRENKCQRMSSVVVACKLPTKSWREGATYSISEVVYTRERVKKKNQAKEKGSKTSYLGRELSVARGLR